MNSCFCSPWQSRGLRSVSFAETTNRFSHADLTRQEMQINLQTVCNYMPREEGNDIGNSP